MSFQENVNELRYKYWLNVVIGMVTGLLSGIITSSVYASDNTIAYIGLFVFLIISVVFLLIKIIAPQCLSQKLWMGFSDIIGLGMGTGFVTGVGAVALDKGQYGILGLVILFLLCAIVVVIIKRKKISKK